MADLPLTTEVAALIDRFGKKAVVDAVRSHKGKRGRPSTRRNGVMDSDEFLVWLTVEQYKIAHPKASDDHACEMISEAGGIAFLEFDSTKEIVARNLHANARGIARIYSEAKRLRSCDKNLAAAWNRALDDMIGREHKAEDLAPRMGGFLRENE